MTETELIDLLTVCQATTYRNCVPDEEIMRRAKLHGKGRPTENIGL